LPVIINDTFPGIAVPENKEFELANRRFFPTLPQTETVPGAFEKVTQMLFLPLCLNGLKLNLPAGRQARRALS